MQPWDKELCRDRPGADDQPDSDQHPMPGGPETQATSGDGEHRRHEAAGRAGRREGREGEADRVTDLAKVTTSPAVPELVPNDFAMLSRTGCA